MAPSVGASSETVRADGNHGAIVVNGERVAVEFMDSGSDSCGGSDSDGTDKDGGWCNDDDGGWGAEGWGNDGDAGGGDPVGDTQTAAGRFNGLGG